jgi:dihydropteroate synthase
MNSLISKEGSHQGPFFAPSWNIGRLVLQPSRRPLIMGILNLTPDSFYDGGRFNSLDAALAKARTMIEAGADVLDLGAESSRPGSDSITAEEEMARLLPVLEAIRSESMIPITVDTFRPITARAALSVGADAINDISGGQDPEMLKLIASAGCGLILMHMQGTPATMQDQPSYENVVAEVAGFLERRCEAAQQAGVAEDRLMVDPGIGFGKALEHNLNLLSALQDVRRGKPLLLGASRKRFISDLTGSPVDDRLPGSLAALAAAFQGSATMVRVHDVPESIQFLDVLGSFPH